MQIWLTILVSWPEPAGPISTHALAYAAITGCGRLEHGRVVAAAHDRELPVLGARLAARHRRVDEADAALATRRGQLPGEPADAVVWSTSTAPAAHRRPARRRPERRRRARRRRCRRTGTPRRRPRRASAGVGAAALPFSATHASAFDARAVVDGDLVAGPARCRAIGAPIVPIPRNATSAHPGESATLPEWRCARADRFLTSGDRLGGDHLEPPRRPPARHRTGGRGARHRIARRGAAPGDPQATGRRPGEDARHAVHMGPEALPLHPPRAALGRGADDPHGALARRCRAHRGERQGVDVVVETPDRGMGTHRQARRRERCAPTTSICHRTSSMRVSGGPRRFGSARWWPSTATSTT